MKVSNGPTNALGFVNVISITYLSLTLFVYLSADLQSDEKKNTNAILICQNQTTLNSF
jgi:hypothetical protein